MHFPVVDDTLFNKKEACNRKEFEKLVENNIY